MISVIFTYYDEKGEEKIAAGNYEYFQVRKKICKQLVNRLAYEHTEEWWCNLRDMKPGDVSQTLLEALRNNVLHTFRPN